jgi:hypothetical protein
MTPSEWIEAIGPHSTPEDVAPFLDHPQTEEAHLLRLLRKRELPSAILEAVARHERWDGQHSIRAAIVLHGKTPRTLGLRLLSLLRWRDQLRVATEVRLHMPLRAAAESRLRERLPELELGEKISLARSAPPGLLSVLAADESHRVVAALLSNPRLSEGDVVAIVRRERTPAEVLRVVASSARWISRPAIRSGILSHPATPVHSALSVLAGLSLGEIEKLVAEHALPPIVRAGAERILSGRGESRRGRRAR